jgi:Zn-dependent peptidase ImmA (M78 family)/DNA-binding XRE family transcriptional regulator
MAEVPVIGGVLVWAREFRGLSLDEAAQRIKIPVDELRALEEGLIRPSLTTFERIASVYRLPPSTLFRRTPPTEPKKPTDFRTFDGAPHEESFDFQIALSNVRSFQATLKALDIEDEEFRRVELRKCDFGGDPFEQGEVERRKIGVSIDRQLHWKSDEGFRHWRAIIEQMGIAVYLQKYPTTDCRGWSIADDPTSPAIIINKEEHSPNARTFTLIHEYAHLLIRRPGISDLKSENPTEAFCNRFAGAFLMPEEALKLLLPNWPENTQAWDGEIVRDAALRLKVSAQALAIRLEELKKAPRGFSRRFATKPRLKSSDKSSGGGDAIGTRLSELGGRFTQSVINALDREVIDIVHASEALGFTPTRLERARAYIERYQSLAG